MAEKADNNIVMIEDEEKNSSSFLQKGFSQNQLDVNDSDSDFEQEACFPISFPLSTVFSSLLSLMFELSVSLSLSLSL
jgi:hypothetical protein